MNTQLVSIHPLNNEAWQEWVEFRAKEIRKKIGPIAERKQRTLLQSYPPAIQQHIIDTSINCGWQGLFPPKGRVQQAPDYSQMAREAEIWE